MVTLKVKQNKAPKAEKAEKKEKSEKVISSHDSRIESVIRRPRITEKATFSASKNVYVFEVSLEANRMEVARAIRHVYSVTPQKVRIVAIPSKRVFVRGTWGIKKGGRKAYVYLKKGDKIEIV